MKTKNCDLFYEHKADKESRREKIKRDNKKNKHSEKTNMIKVNRGKINLNLDMGEE